MTLAYAALAGLLLLAGIAAVALLAAVAGTAALIAVRLVRLVRWVLDRSAWNGRPVVDELETLKRAAAMSRHPSALGPRRDLERLAALPTEELEAVIDQAVGEALGQAVDRALWHGIPTRLVEADLTELLPRFVDVTTYEDEATVLEQVYPPRVQPRPVIPNDDAAASS